MYSVCLLRLLLASDLFINSSLQNLSVGFDPCPSKIFNPFCSKNNMKREDRCIYVRFSYVDNETVAEFRGRFFAGQREFTAKKATRE